jgi:serine/threonine protein kinase
VGALEADVSQSFARFTTEGGIAYDADREIGRGVLTSVLSAREHRATTPVAIKTVLPLWTGHPLAEARIARERELSLALHASDSGHACARVLDGGRQKLDDGRERPFHVSPLYDGTTLAERLRDSAPVSASLALRWGDEVLSGLECLHALGWVHRDVKPANIFLLRAPEQNRNDRCMLMDFGLAVPVGVARGDADEPFGTPAYVSPEVVAGANLDARADLYSFALVLFELLCGRRPFLRRDPVGLVEAHLGEAPPALRELCPELSVELNGVIGATLGKEPGERPSCAAELRSLLKKTPEART